jgi:predicted PurR-regulated permease PerM
MLAERILMGLLMGAIALGCFVVLAPFLSAILWASILTFTTWPAYALLRAKLGLRPGAASGLMVAVTTVVVVLPLALAAPGSATEVQQMERWLTGLLSTGLPPAPAWVIDLPLAGPTIGDLWNRWAHDLSAMVAFFRPYFGIGVQFGLGLLLGLANGVLQFVLALFVAFFLYISGETIAGRLVVIVRRIAGERADPLIAVTGETVRGVVYGILGTAVIQGMLTTFGLWISGVPSAVLLGVIAGAMSVLPIGAPVVWIPSAIWLLASGETGWGIFLFAWGAVVIGSADNVIRPYFIARGAKLPFLLTTLGVLGGALAFGLLGVFLGPVLLAVAYTLVLEWSGRAQATPDRIP